MTKTKNAPSHPRAAHRGSSPATATVGTITMRVGGKYVLRNGAEVECRARKVCAPLVFGKVIVEEPYVFFVGPFGSGLTWNQEGRYCAVDLKSDFDVVAEIPS